MHCTFNVFFNAFIVFFNVFFNAFIYSMDACLGNWSSNNSHGRWLTPQ